MTELKLPFLAKLTLALLSIIAIGFLLYIGQIILSPLFFAFLMAILFTPFAEFMERRLHFSRTISSLFSFFILAASLGGIIYFFTVQLSNFVNDFPALQTEGMKSFHHIQVWIYKTFHMNIHMQLDYIDQGVKKLLNLSGEILGFTFAMFTSIGTYIVFSIFFFILILNYRKQIYLFISTVYSDKHTSKVAHITSEIQHIIKKYILGLFIQIAIVSILTGILTSIVGLKYVLLLSLLAGFLNIIPYIGIILACLISCVLSIATGNPNTLWLLLGFGIIHAIDANVTLPFIVSSRVRINALVSFLGLIVGEQIWGISGMFLSIPLLAIMKIIFDNIDELKPWGHLLGETRRSKSKKRKSAIQKEEEETPKPESTPEVSE